MKSAVKQPEADTRRPAPARSQEAPAKKTGGAEPRDATPQPPFSWRTHRIPLTFTLSVILCDHLTKWWAIVRLRPDGWPEQIVPPVPVIPIIPGFFDFQYAENTGAAFSIFAQHPGVLTIVSLLIATVIFWWYWRTPQAHRGTRIALALVLGGAIGNLIDRLFRGSVVDFIHVFWRQYHWPTFNIADSAICIGIGLLILWSFREQKTP